ncbi:hypothetical protein GE061_016177 [Apolygus lucorum]|uniref:Uncharacterized protein n=1 Tax=Apolygus lucorum TaxID=248454 RepID=A0A8S9XGL6_APOLU|nr:hypothetical protein GE061_016177 [Apolygus lucorum]
MSQMKCRTFKSICDVAGHSCVLKVVTRTVRNKVVPSTRLIGERRRVPLVIETPSERISLFTRLLKVTDMNLIPTDRYKDNQFSKSPPEQASSSSEAQCCSSEVIIVGETLLFSTPPPNGNTQRMETGQMSQEDSAPSHE